MPVVFDCPIDTAINVIKGKCKAAIILNIQEGVNRFGLLKKGVAVSEKLLALQLLELEADGIIVKEKNKNNQLQTFYYLTPDGLALCKIIEEMKAWGNGYKLFKHINS